MKQRKTIWMASIASFYHLQIYKNWYIISCIILRQQQPRLDVLGFLKQSGNFYPPQPPQQFNSSRCRAMRDWHHLPKTTWVEILSKNHLAKCNIQEFSNIPLEHTPDPEPTVYEGIPSIWGFGEAWGMLQGYVGGLLDNYISST